MASPGVADVHVDAALTSYSRAYFHSPNDFIWNKVAPLVGVPKQSDRYYIYTLADTARTDAQKRAPGTEIALRDYTLSNTPYFCDVVGVGMDISEQVTANADPALDPEADAMRVLIEDLNIYMEQQWAATFFVTGVWGTSNNAQNWADDASDPIGALLTAKSTIRQNTGFQPNTLILGATAWENALANHPDILSRIPAQMPAAATPEFLGQLVGLNVLVAGTIRNTAAENLTASYSDNLGGHALVCYVEPNPGLRSQTSMITFNWTALTGAADGIRAKRYDIPQTDAFPRLEVEIAFDQVLTASDMGYWFNTVTS